jgi:hypothetical protein
VVADRNGGHGPYAAPAGPDTPSATRPTR